ncbi:TPA: LTA synthase family protein [Streptococcus suis]
MMDYFGKIKKFFLRKLNFKAISFKGFNFKEINFKEINFKPINYKAILHFSILLLATGVIGTYLISEHLVDYQSAISEILNFRSLIKICFLISAIVLAFYISFDISLNFIFKVGTSYLIYWLISYSLLMTQNINNKKFDWLDFVKNGFFEISSYTLIGIILLGAYVIHILSKRYNFIEKMEKLFLDYGKSYLSLSLLISLVVLQDSKLISNLKSFLTLANTGDLQSYLEVLAYKLPLILGTVTLITFTFWHAIDGIRKNKSTLSLAIVSSFLFALIFNYTLQSGIRADVKLLGMYIFPGATMFQIGFLVLVYMVVYFVINRYWLSTLLIIFSGIAISIANSIKETMRSEPLLLTDFAWIGQLELIFSFVDSQLLQFSIFIIILLTSLYFFLHKRYLIGKIFDSVWKRVILTFSVFVILGSVLIVFANEKDGKVAGNIPAISRLNNRIDISYMGNTINARYRSLMFVWVKQLTKPIMEKPENYNKTAIDELVAKYEKRAEEINKTRTQELSDQTIIFVLSESLSDPTRVQGVTLSRDVLTNINAIKTKTTSGLMKSDGYGGGTANMEIQALIGLPYHNLSPSVSIMNTEVIPKMNRIPSISDSFSSKNKIAIHLGDAHTYSRADVYRRLDFETFIANDKDAIKPSISEKYGLYPSDESTYQNVLDNIDPKENQFFSVITFQNHVPWSMANPNDVSGIGEGFSGKENSELTNYARLLNKTDEATKEFIDKLSKINKKITVVFYGDHLPGLYPESAFADDPESQYLTDYYIWSNKENSKLTFDKINSSDFPAAVLAHTNSKVSPYYALLTDVLKNASVDKEDLTDEQKEIAEDLKLVQFDSLSGSNYLNAYDSFFKIK